MNRSATSVVRDELVRVRATRACDRRAELAGLLRAAGALHLAGGGRFSLEASTESAGVARRLYEALAEALGARGELRLLEPGRGHPKQRYAVVGSGLSLQRLVEAGILDEQGAPGQRLPRRLVAKRCCAGAYLRGVFLVRGSVGDPRGPAHLEIRTDDEPAATEIASLIEQVEARARVRAHRGGWAAYVKDVASIGTVLAAMGAHDAYMAWEDGAVWKSVHVEAARLANADAANARRLARAAAAQLDAIEQIGDLSKLPRALREAAELRRAHPEASIDELARLAQPVVSKGAMAGRLSRLVALAER